MTIGVCSVPGLWRENLLSCIVTTLSCPNTSPRRQPWSIVNTSYSTAIFSFSIIYINMYVCVHTNNVESCMQCAVCMFASRYNGKAYYYRGWSEVMEAYPYVRWLFKGDVDLCFFAVYFCSVYVSATCIEGGVAEVWVWVLGCSNHGYDECGVPTYFCPRYK